MAQQPSPQPDIANMTVAIAGMSTEGTTIAQSLQTYTIHQPNLCNELSLFQNRNVPILNLQQEIIAARQETQQGLAAVRQEIRNMGQELMLFFSAREWNLRAMMDHSKVYEATTQLTVMRNVNQGPEAAIGVNAPIPNFPNTPHDVSQLNINVCRTILTALDRPHPNNQAVRDFRTVVRRAIGLAALSETCYSLAGRATEEK